MGAADAGNVQSLPPLAGHFAQGSAAQPLPLAGHRPVRGQPRRHRSGCQPADGATETLHCGRTLRPGREAPQRGGRRACVSAESREEGVLRPGPARATRCPSRARGRLFWQPAREQIAPSPAGGPCCREKEEGQGKGVGALDRIRRGRCRAGSGRPDCSVDGAGRERQRRFRACRQNEGNLTETEFSPGEAGVASSRSQARNGSPRREAGNIISQSQARNSSSRGEGHGCPAEGRTAGCGRAREGRTGEGRRRTTAVAAAGSGRGRFQEGPGHGPRYLQG